MKTTKKASELVPGETLDMMGVKVKLLKIIRLRRKILATVKIENKDIVWDMTLWNDQKVDVTK